MQIGYTSILRREIVSRYGTKYKFGISYNKDTGKMIVDCDFTGSICVSAGGNNPREGDGLSYIDPEGGPFLSVGNEFLPGWIIESIGQNKTHYQLYLGQKDKGESKENK